MRSLKQNNQGIAAALGAVIAALVAIIIGVLVWFKIDAALITAGWSALPTGAKAAWNNTNTTANTVLTLLPIVCIVMIAGIILAVVMGFGRTGNQT